MSDEGDVCSVASLPDLILDDLWMTAELEPLSAMSFDCAATDLEFDTGYTYSNTGVHTNEPFWFTVN